MKRTVMTMMKKVKERKKKKADREVGHGADHHVADTQMMLQRRKKSTGKPMKMAIVITVALKAMMKRVTPAATAKLKKKE